MTSVQIASWGLHEGSVRVAMPRARVVEDSVGRLWFESPDGPNRRLNYVSVAQEHVACDAQIGVRQSADLASGDIVREIALGVDVSPN